MPVSFNFSNISADHMLYSEKDLEKSMDKIETIHFHEEKDVGGVKFWCYNAGHVLGAAMFMIEIAGVKVPSLCSLHFTKIIMCVIEIAVVNIHFFYFSNFTRNGDARYLPFFFILQQI